jgi:hypothetical protein
VVQEFVSCDEDGESTDSDEGVWDGYSARGRESRGWEYDGEYRGFWTREREFQRPGVSAGVDSASGFWCMYGFCGLIPVSHGDDMGFILYLAFEIELVWIRFPRTYKRAIFTQHLSLS